MAERINSSVKLAALSVTVVVLAAGILFAKGEDMEQIKVEIGRNITETARDSGIPKFSERNIAGLVSYSVDVLPKDVRATYIRTGFEASHSPLFALTMYADHANKNNLAVTALTLQFSTDHLNSHESGQDFVESIIAQFLSKKWIRFIRESCPAVTGRSNFIEIDGSIRISGACALDPTYKLSPEDWRQLAIAGLSYKWIGEGVIATVLVDAR